MGSFLDATHVVEKDGALSAELDSDWFIWGPFGGYLAALAMRAAGTRSRHRRPATFSCQFLNKGAEGPVNIAVVSRKSGRSAECLSVSVSQGTATLLEAQSWIVTEDLAGLHHEHTRLPVIEPPEAVAPFVPLEDSAEEESAIWRYVERRPRDVLNGPDHVPGIPEWACWLRLNETIPADDWFAQAARAVLWMDLAPWNAVMRAHEWPMTHVAPTLDLTVQFQTHLYGPAVTASDWLLASVESPTAGDGLLGARGEIWSEKGKLVAVGTAQAVCMPNPHLNEQTDNKRQRLASRDARQGGSATN